MGGRQATLQVVAVGRRRVVLSRCCLLLAELSCAQVASLEVQLLGSAASAARPRWRGIRSRGGQLQQGAGRGNESSSWYMMHELCMRGAQVPMFIAIGSLHPVGPGGAQAPL